MAITENFSFDLYALTQQRFGIGAFAWITLFEMDDFDKIVYVRNYACGEGTTPMFYVLCSMYFSIEPLLIFKPV